jgi:predicted permease
MLSALIAVAAAARYAWRLDAAALMRGTAGTVRVGRWALRDVLLAVQVVFCSLLVTSALVALAGLNRTLTTSLGFNADGVFVASFDLNQAGYNRGSGLAFRRTLLERMAALPGIAGVTFTSSVPLTTDQSSDTIMAAGPATREDSRGVDAKAFMVPAGYFATMGTRLVAGREFTSTDAGVVIVNQSLARTLFNTTDVIGRGIRTGPTEPVRRIVGVAEDGKYALPGEAPRPAIFWNGMQAYRSATQLLVRSSRPAAEVARDIRSAVGQLDSGLPVTFQGSLREVIALAFLPATAAATILGALGVLAMALAITGVYGLAAYSVSTRIREIGIRLALGARSTDVFHTVLGRIAIVLFAGGCAGLVVVWAANSVLALVVYQASSRDPLILASGAALMVLIGVTAAMAPARRALKVDPAATMREG